MLNKLILLLHIAQIGLSASLTILSNNNLRSSFKTLSNEVSFVDTSGFVGAQYQPSSSTNEDWWYHFDEYEDSIKRELAMVHKVMGFTALRVFLHSFVYSGLGKEKMLHNMHKFLKIAEKNEMKVGFVFFDDCWMPVGMNLTQPCLPRKGVHNGCWMTSPQAIERPKGVDSFKPYVTDIITEFKSDTRIAWWEIFNEPNKIWLHSYELRKAAYGWIKSLSPLAPIASCWDENDDADMVDVHQYNDQWNGINNSVFSNTSGRMVGGIVTEAGARWYQNSSSTSGSPLTVIDWLTKLKRNPLAKFVPGVMIDWEVMVSNSNTRWKWNTPFGAAEPVIPWHQHVYADGSPVSYTEAAVIRNYITGKKEWHYLNTFLDVPGNEDSHDLHYSLNSGESFDIDVNLHKYIFETTIKVVNGSAEVLFQQSDFGHYIIRINFDSLNLSLMKYVAFTNITYELSSFDISALDCKAALNAWNMLRVKFTHGEIQIWFNPMFLDIYPEELPTPLKINVKVQAMPPRITFYEHKYQTLPPGGISISAKNVNNGIDIDYISVLPDIIYGTSYNY